MIQMFHTPGIPEDWLNELSELGQPPALWYSLMRPDQAQDDAHTPAADGAFAELALAFDPLHRQPVKVVGPERGDLDRLAFDDLVQVHLDSLS